MKRKTSRLLLSAVFTLSIGSAWADTTLPRLDLDPAQTSVSGLSSGGFMAVQLHIAYSGTFKKGAGIIAGGPFYCAQNSMQNAMGYCMKGSAISWPWFWIEQTIPLQELVAITRNWAREKRIDPTENLKESKVYLYSGTKDTTVVQKVVDNLLSYYQNFVDPKNITYKNNLESGHAFIIDGPAGIGNQCDTSKKPYIDNCKFDLPGAILQHIYGPLTPPTPPTSPTAGKTEATKTTENSPPQSSGKLYAFDQSAFVKKGLLECGFDAECGIASKGWLYVPQSCEENRNDRNTGNDKKFGKCRLHVVLHGCQQSELLVGDNVIKHAGYNRWADNNNIVILYPQTGLLAMNGCWDWWGYSGSGYAEKSAPQMRAIKKMVDRVVGE